jgi:hypothetical protein
MGELGECLSLPAAPVCQYLLNLIEHRVKIIENFFVSDP